MKATAGELASISHGPLPPPASLMRCCHALGLKDSGQAAGA